MPGHGNCIHRLPLTPLPSIIVPFSSTITGCTPGSGRPAKLGFNGVTPAIADIICPPFSVCHQVSTIGQLPWPIFSSNQCQASSLIGSPTDPSLVNELKSFCLSGSSPKQKDLSSLT